MEKKVWSAEVIRDGSHMLLVLPKELVTEMGLTEGEKVEVSLEGKTAEFKPFGQ